MMMMAMHSENLTRTTCSNHNNSKRKCLDFWMMMRMMKTHLSHYKNLRTCLMTVKSLSKPTKHPKFRKRCHLRCPCHRPYQPNNRSLSQRLRHCLMTTKMKMNQLASDQNLKLNQHYLHHQFQYNLSLGHFWMKMTKKMKALILVRKNLKHLLRKQWDNRKRKWLICLMMMMKRKKRALNLRLYLQRLSISHYFHHHLYPFNKDKNQSYHHRSQ